MFLHIPNLLTQEQVDQARGLLEKAEWVDGRLTAGHVYIGSFMTHKQYDRWSAGTRKERSEWLQF